MNKIMVLKRLRIFAIIILAILILFVGYFFNDISKYSVLLMFTLLIIVTLIDLYMYYLNKNISLQISRLFLALALLLIWASLFFLNYDIDIWFILFLLFITIAVLFNIIGGETLTWKEFKKSWLWSKINLFYSSDKKK